MPELVERTALAPFSLAGIPVAAGARIKLTLSQLQRCVVAGTVHEDAALDAEVPVIDAGVDHAALDAAAGNAAHYGTGEVQRLDDGSAARAQAQAQEVERLRIQDLARQAEVEAAAKRAADLEAERLRADEIARQAEVEAAAKRAADLEAEKARKVPASTASPASAPPSAPARSNAPPTPPAPGRA